MHFPYFTHRVRAAFICPTQLRMEGKDSNQGLTPKQITANHILKLGAPNQKYQTRPKQNTTTHQKLMRWAGAAAIWGEYGLLTG